MVVFGSNTSMHRKSVPGSNECLEPAVCARAAATVATAQRAVNRRFSLDEQPL